MEVTDRRGSRFGKRTGEPTTDYVPDLTPLQRRNLAEREAQPTDAEKVETMCDLVTELEKALRSKRLTVQVMPDGVEIIKVESGDLVRKLMVTEVLPDERDSTDA